MISELGKSGKIATLDISQPFRLLIVNPVNFDLLGIMFEGKFNSDNGRCNLFFPFSDIFLHWLVQIKSCIDTLDHYLDYFIFAGEAITNDF